MAKEMSKLKGVPVMQVMRMGDREWGAAPRRVRSSFAGLERTCHAERWGSCKAECGVGNFEQTGFGGFWKKEKRSRTRQASGPITNRPDCRTNTECADGVKHATGQLLVSPNRIVSIQRACWVFAGCCGQHIL